MREQISHMILDTLAMHRYMGLVHLVVPILAAAASLMFGVPLAEICKREGGTVPFIVRRIVKHIEDEGLDQEGIYRVNGNSRVIERLKADFDRGRNL